MGERLQKVMARAGVASRRACERIIRGGRVTVNGRVVTELGTRVTPGVDQIAVDGKPLKVEPLTYILLHKPAGYITTVRDPQGRPTVMDLVPGVGVRLFPVGRLDYDSSGLLILTNDGELANALTHPRYGARKTYRVLVRGGVSEEALKTLQRGVQLSDGPARAHAISVEGKSGGNTWLEVVLTEGRNRMLRRMLAAVGLEVLQLIRVEEAGISLGALPPGQFRHLTPSEVESLRAHTRHLRHQSPHGRPHRHQPC